MGEDLGRYKITECEEDTHKLHFQSKHLANKLLDTTAGLTIFDSSSFFDTNHEW